MNAWSQVLAVAALVVFTMNTAYAQSVQPGAPGDGVGKTQLTAKDDSRSMSDKKQEKEGEPHEGFFGHLDLGLGYAAVRGGSLPPEPGFRPIDDLSFSGVVLATSAQVGGGVEDFALAAELLYEVMLTEREEPDNVGFQMFGIGIAGAHYTDDDFLIGAQLRYLGMLLWRDNIPCFWDRGVTASGPGVGVTLGKEWFRDSQDDHRREGGMGIALQGNYATFDGGADFDYLSFLLQLSMTRF